MRQRLAEGRFEIGPAGSVWPSLIERADQIDRFPQTRSGVGAILASGLVLRKARERSCHEAPVGGLLGIVRDRTAQEC